MSHVPRLSDPSLFVGHCSQRMHAQRAKGLAMEGGGEGKLGERDRGLGVEKQRNETKE